MVLTSMWAPKNSNTAPAMRWNHWRVFSFCNILSLDKKPAPKPSINKGESMVPSPKKKANIIP